MDSPSLQMPKYPVQRLVFQGSIPIEDREHALQWYNMLKEMMVSQSAKSTLNGQIITMLDPCCSKSVGQNLNTGVQNTGPSRDLRL